MSVVEGTFGKQRGGQELLRLLEELGVGKDEDAPKFMAVIDLGTSMSLMGNVETEAEMLLLLQQGSHLVVEASIG